MRVESEELRVRSAETGVDSNESSGEEAGAAVEADTPVEAAVSPARPLTLNSQLLTPNSPKPRVLVVEDQPDLRDYLRQLLAPTCEVLT
nr:hypothetical protein [Tanacetum cinerariifolium]